MSIIVFLLQTVFISFSGVLAPGPVTAVTISKGSKNPHAGALISLGHGIVDFPLIFLIFLGFDSLINKPYVKEIIGIAGGIFLLWMGADILRGLKTAKPKSKIEKRSPVVAGVFLSLGNPYFIVWWATIGAALIARSAEFGFFWFTVFAVVHWLCDFLWLYFLSFISYRGGTFFGKKFQKIVFVICGVFLLFLGGKFIIDAFIGFPH
ncbi:MAG: LysE family transporter [candidate division WOR-3 bacterium]